MYEDCGIISHIDYKTCRRKYKMVRYDYCGTVSPMGKIIYGYCGGISVVDCKSLPQKIGQM